MIITFISLNKILNLNFINKKYNQKRRILPKIFKRDFWTKMNNQPSPWYAIPIKIVTKIKTSGNIPCEGRCYPIYDGEKLKETNKWGTHLIVYYVIFSYVTSTYSRSI